MIHVKLFKILFFYNTCKIFSNFIFMIHCEEVDFEGEFGEQQVIDEDIIIRSMRFMSIARIYIDLNK